MKKFIHIILLSGTTIFIASVQLSATSYQYYLSPELEIPFRSSEVFSGLGRSARDMVVLEDMLYVADWDAFFQIDVSDSKHPQLVAKWKLDVEKLMLHGDYMYALGRTQLDVLRVHSKSPIEHIKSLSFDNKVVGFVVDEHRGYVALASQPDTSSADQIMVYDLTMPENPEFLIGWNNVPKVRENNWCVQGGFLFFHNGLDLEVFEFNDFSTPQRIARVSGANESWITMIKKEGDTLYGFGGAIQIIHIGDPYHPILEQEIPFPRNHGMYGSSPTGMGRMGDFLVLSGEDFPFAGSGLARSGYVALIDLSHPEETEISMEVNMEAPLIQTVDEKLWTLSRFRGMTVYEVHPAPFALETTPLTQPFIEVLDSNVDLSRSMTLEQGGIASDVVESLNTHWNGRTHFDFTKLRQLGNEVVVDHGIAYSIGSAGLRMFDVHDPKDPIKLGQWDTLGAETIEIQSPYVFLLDDTGLKVIDCVNPREPTHLASISFDEHVSALAVDELSAYVALDNLVYFINTRQIGNPTVLKTIQTTSFVRDLEVYGHYLYVLTGNGIELIDVADPLHPRHLGGNSSFYFDNLDLVDGNILVSGRFGNENVAAVGSIRVPRLLTEHLPHSDVLPLLLRGFPEQIIHLERSPDTQTWKSWRTVKMTGFTETVYDRTEMGGNVFYRIAGESNP